MFAGGTRLLTVIFSVAAVAAIAILIADRHIPTPGDISQALTSNPGAYKLSLGHMEDLTLKSFAYLRLPLGLAAVAFVIAAVGTLLRARQRGSTWRLPYDGGLLSGRPPGNGQLRPLPIIQALGRRTGAVAARHDNRRPATTTGFLPSSSIQRDCAAAERKVLSIWSMAPMLPGQQTYLSTTANSRSSGGGLSDITSSPGTTRSDHLKVAGKPEHSLIPSLKSGGKVLLTNHPIAAKLAIQCKLA